MNLLESPSLRTVYNSFFPGALMKKAFVLKKMQFITYLKEVRNELSKVIWPKRSEVMKLTLTVLTVSAIIGAYVGILDFSFTKFLGLIITR